MVWAVKWSSEERLQWKFHTMSPVKLRTRAADMEGSFLKLQSTASEACFKLHTETRALGSARSKFIARQSSAGFQECATKRGILRGACGVEDHTGLSVVQRNSVNFC